MTNPAGRRHPMVAAIARRIVELTEAFGSCSEQDLRRSFSADDVKRYMDAARDEAARQLGNRNLDAAA